MRNEMHIRLKWLHKTVKCSCFFLVKAEKYLTLWKQESYKRMLSSSFTDELHLVAHRVECCHFLQR
jgi:hypothetical protein